MKVGDKISLGCSSNSLVFIGWTKRSGTDTESTRIEYSDRIKKNDLGLIIENATLSDDGDYTCHIINEEGGDKKTVKVSVVSTPKFLTTANQNKTQFAGSTSTFACLADGNPPPTLSWWRNGRPIEDSEKYAIIKKSATFKVGTSLRILKSEKSDSGAYECRARNDYGRARTIFNLEIQAPTEPVIISISEPLRVPVESTVYLRCEATGIPAPQLRWTKNGRKFLIHDRFMMTKKYLKIEDTRVDDSGYYGCWAVSVGGKTAKRVKARILFKRDLKNEILNFRIVS